ncbi:MAG: sugar transferase [Clostridiales bacterium]|nr:sugar transferase [Clostridiales bacterium]
MLVAWDKLPEFMRTEAVRPYYELLRKKRAGLFCKRAFDICAASVLLLLLAPVFLAVAIAVRADSPGPVFFRQPRVTRHGRIFRIFKFRSMTQGAERGATVTVQNDARVTRVGKFLRRTRLDETPQVFNILAGQLTFVGTRPPLPVSLGVYREEWNATLLLPAGVTSAASIAYKNEEDLLRDAVDPVAVYNNEILPAKMAINLAELRSFSFWRDLGTLVRTLGAVAR